MPSSSTFHSEKQSSSLPIASSNNCNGISSSRFDNLWAVEHNKEHPQFASGPLQSGDSFISLCWSLNAETAVGSGLSGYNENLANVGSSGIQINPKQFPNQGLNTNHVLRFTVNPTGDSFDLFDVPFIDNNGRNDVVNPSQLFDNTNNGVYIGNQYVPDVDLGLANEDENDLYIDQSTIDDDFIWKAEFCQHLINQQETISTTGYAAEAAIPNVPMPSTSEASHVDWQHTQWPDNNENDIFPFPRKKKHSKKLLPNKNLYILHNDKPGQPRKVLSQVSKSALLIPTSEDPCPQGKGNGHSPGRKGGLQWDTRGNVVY
ncbi:hypothetical protein Clacol_001020 [Clathrus columnatus]|uniref:Uncharacterized protein n=1 Tax=Clathrus columnatus TaxID=1419009 RepID=A0AAV4ZXJ8_9AGAM|nr:hypothetical protein Clacol_001020 [Clathrus columnatus]